jgi:dolichol kinase
MKIGEVAASASGDEDLFPESVCVIEYGDAAATLAGFDGAHQSGGASAENEGVEGMGHEAHM